SALRPNTPLNDRPGPSNREHLLSPTLATRVRGRKEAQPAPRTSPARLREMFVALVGFGRFGRALGSLLAEAQVPHRALDPQVEVPQPVRAAGIAELLGEATLVVLAVPVPRTREALASLRPPLTAGHTVLDVGSVKVRPFADLEAVLGDDVPWVASHPLFGPLSLALAERPLRVVLC